MGDLSADTKQGPVGLLLDLKGMME